MSAATKAGQGGTETGCSSEVLGTLLFVWCGGKGAGRRRIDKGGRSDAARPRHAGASDTDPEATARRPCRGCDWADGDVIGSQLTVHCAATAASWASWPPYLAGVVIAKGASRGGLSYGDGHSVHAGWLRLIGAALRRGSHPPQHALRCLQPAHGLPTNLNTPGAEMPEIALHSRGHGGLYLAWSIQPCVCPSTYWRLLQSGVAPSDLAWAALDRMESLRVLAVKDFPLEARPAASHTCVSRSGTLQLLPSNDVGDPAGCPRVEQASALIRADDVLRDGLRVQLAISSATV